METPINPMMITVAISFNGHINYDRLVKDLGVIVQRYRRFRQRIIRPQQIFRRPYWEDDPSSRVEDHIERIELENPSETGAVEQMVNKIMNIPLDFAHPLWQLTLVDNLPEGSIIIVRIHHCIADGISLMQVLLQMTHPAPEEQKGEPKQSEPNSNREPNIMPTMVQSASNNTAVGVATKATAGVGLGYRKPTIPELIAASLRIVFRMPDPPTILKKPLGQVKKAVWSEAFSVPEIKKIAQSRQATINDVLMSVASGAIRRYMDFHNDHRKRNIRAFIMVNMRGRSLDEDLGNKFGLVFLKLPLDREQPLGRLDDIKQDMDSLKASAEYAATYLILNILGQLPGWVETLAIRILDMKGTVVATNVPGSRRQLYLADAPIQSLIGWVPQSGRIGVGLSFISYNDQLVVGLNTDARVIPDPEKFLQFFTEEYTSLRTAVSIDSEAR